MYLTSDQRIIIIMITIFTMIFLKYYISTWPTPQLPSLAKSSSGSNQVQPFLCCHYAYAYILGIVDHDNVENIDHGDSILYYTILYYTKYRKSSKKSNLETLNVLISKRLKLRKTPLSPSLTESNFLMLRYHLWI